MKTTFKGLPRLFFSALLITLITIIACRKSFFDRKPEVQVNITDNKYVVDYQSTTKDSVLRFELKISKKEKTADIINEVFEIDLKGNKYLKSIYQTLQDRSLDNNYSNLTLGQAQEICISLREVIADHTKSLTPEQLKSPNIQGMYMGLSFVRRILKNKLGVSQLASKIKTRKDARQSTDTRMEDNPVLLQPPFAQDVFEGYEIGLSPFVLNEDIIVDRLEFLTVVNEDAAAVVQDDQGLYVFQDVLNSLAATSFSLKDFLAEMDFYIMQHPENIESGSGGCLGGWWPSGSSHGCCGNYAGCCWYWHNVCYIHDKICKKCKPRWFCFSGCIPDGPPKPSPFTFIEDVVPEEYLPPGQSYFIPLGPSLLPLQEIYYKINFVDLSANIPQHFTTINYNPADQKYYTDASLSTFVPVGYYDSPTEINGNIHKYYYIENGLASVKYSIVIAD